MSIFSSLDLIALDGTPFDAHQLAGKAVLVVNVASRCGLTPQYTGLEALAATPDLVVLGVPCNQFGGQEPGSAEEIATFCSTTYGVTFPMLAKQDVNGDTRSALYERLVSSDAGGGHDISWNFEKFLVGPQGDVLQRFAPTTAPDDSALVDAIRTATA